MYWRPSPPPPPLGGDVPDRLRQLLGRRLWDHDGSLVSDPYTLNAADLEYLAGLRDAGVDGADGLMRAIAEHGAVEVWIER